MRVPRAWGTRSRFPPLLLSRAIRPSCRAGSPPSPPLTGRSAPYPLHREFYAETQNRDSLGDCVKAPANEPHLPGPPHPPPSSPFPPRPQAQPPTRFSPGRPRSAGHAGPGPAGRARRPRRPGRGGARPRNAAAQSIRRRGSGGGRPEGGSADLAMDQSSGLGWARGGAGERGVLPSLPRMGPPSRPDGGMRDTAPQGGQGTPGQGPAVPPRSPPRPEESERFRAARGTARGRRRRLLPAGRARGASCRAKALPLGRSAEPQAWVGSEGRWRWDGSLIPLDSDKGTPASQGPSLLATSEARQKVRSVLERGTGPHAFARCVSFLFPAPKQCCASLLSPRSLQYALVTLSTAERDHAPSCVQPFPQHSLPALLIISII